MNTSEEVQAYADAAAQESWADAMEQRDKYEYDRKVQALVDEAIADGRKLASFRVIDELLPIPGADRIEVARIGGWKVVVKVGEFKEGDLCVFFEVDSFLDARDPRFKFLEKEVRTFQGVEGIKLKTIRLRKQLSQGLALPVTQFPELKEMYETWDPVMRTMQTESFSFEGVELTPIADINLTGKLKVMKWELPMTEEMLKTMKNNFPSLIPRTSLDRAQNIEDEIFETQTFEHEGKLLSKTPVPGDTLQARIDDQVAKGRFVKVGDDYFMYRGEAHDPIRWEVSIKLDGSSMTVFSSNQFSDEMQHGICSSRREMRIENNEDGVFIKDGTPLLEFIKANGEYANYAFQGELMGPGMVESNHENLPERKFFLYRIYDLNNGKFLTPPERHSMVDEINEKAGYELITHVPVLHEAVTLEDLGITNMDQLLAFANGPSLYNPSREGVVFKSVDGTRQFKVISNNFLEGK